VSSIQTQRDTADQHLAGDQEATTRQSLSDPESYRAPRLECDVVMKGGITSGIVYPWAAAELARRYRFRSVGGASAGAIAAVAVAAAEHRRRTQDTGEGFASLAEVPGELGAGPADRPRLLTLFQPDPTTARLFDVALAALAKNKLGLARALLRALPTARARAATALGVGVALILLECAALLYSVIATAAAVALVLATIAFSLIATAVAAGFGLAADLRAIPKTVAKNDFGLCRLGPPQKPDSAASEPLTPWLYQRIQTIAGIPLDRPLTFGALWGMDLPGGLCPVHGQDCPYARERPETMRQRMRSSTSCRAIDLELMTTNLTSGRPVRLPVLEYGDMRRTLTDLGNLYFDPTEFARFFPEPVVTHLKQKARPPSSQTLAKLKAAAEQLELQTSRLLRPRPCDTSRSASICQSSLQHGSASASRD
jgi:hypothetical protein